MNSFFDTDSDSTVDSLMAEPSCSVCPGLLTPLGVLGTLAHFRCVNCGSVTWIENGDNDEGSAYGVSTTFIA